MQFRPCLYESPLFLRYCSDQQIHWIDAKHRDLILMIGMEMRYMMWGSRSRKHTGR